jgi:hypothetical protein
LQLNGGSSFDLGRSPRTLPAGADEAGGTAVSSSTRYGTTSRRYSTTFTALRQARHEHVLQRLHGGERRDPWGRPVSEGASCEQRRWQFTGAGYRTPGDAWLAESARTRALEQRRIAREELRTRAVRETGGDEGRLR